MMPRYTHVLSTLLGMAVMLGGVGCASIEKRIAGNREYFESRPEAIRQQIREGKVDIGFTQKDVYLALGPPDARYSRRTTSGQSAVWAYWQYTSRSPSRFWSDHWYPLGYRYDPPPYHRFHERVAYERMRIVFDTAGEVTAIEENDPPP